MKFFSQKIIDLDEKFFGLDLSDSSIKVFQLEKKGAGSQIRSFGLQKIPAGLIENGQIIDQEGVAQAIKDAVRAAGPKKINTTKVICSIPESKVFLRIISVPKISEKEAAEAIKWEIEANIPLSVDQVYYDWQFLDQTDSRQNVLTIAVAKEVVDGLAAVLEKCDLEIRGFEMESIATVRSLVPYATAEKNGQTFLITDIGEEKTSFIITKDNIAHFTSSIPFSSSGITEVIASQMKVTREEAEKIKTGQGIQHDLENDAVFNSVKPFLENLAVEIEKTVDFYNNISKNRTEINKIIVSGGGANLKGLTEYLTKRLSKEVTIGEPWTNLNLGDDLPPVCQSGAACFATAVGLAMWENEKMKKLNLIPPKKKELIAQKNRWYSVLRLELILATFFSIGSIVLLCFWYILRLELSAQDLAGQNNANAARYEEIKNYDNKFFQINTEMGKIMTVKNDQLYWSVLFSKLNELVFSGITIKSLLTEDWRVNLSGTASTREDLILFKEKLEGENCFSEINLPLSNLVEKNDFEFRLSFKLDKNCLKKR